MEMKTFRIAVGANLYYWPRQQMFDFYTALADSSADIITLGETVCSRRHELKAADWLAIAADLSAAGKEVVLATQTLIESAGEANAMRRLCQQGDHLVEAGDLGAVRARQGQPFVAGLHLNAYHGDTLHWLASLGACRFLVPVEMSHAELAVLMQEKPQDMAAEVMVWGRMPLAFSSRCFTARHYHLDKDHCAYRCLDHADGLDMKTRDGAPFLAINGIQTQSGHCLDLIDAVPQLLDLGVDVLRVSPQSVGTDIAIARLAAWRAEHPIDPIDQIDIARHPTLPANMRTCNGYWHGRPGIEETQTC